ncbi:MAG: toprim domain-containing protein [Lactococcus lactis]|nr:toprim domain-containing protein [Lactococcus lactis]
MDGLKDTTISRHLYELLAEKEGLTDINLDDAKKLLPILANTNFFDLDANRELITLAVDNDKAGLGFIEKLKSKNIKFDIDLPPLENNQEKMDWNDFLKQKKALDLSQEPNIGSGTFNRTSSSLDSQAVKEVPQPVDQLSINEKYITDGGKELMSLVTTKELDQNKPEILKEESIQLSDKSFDSEFPSEVSEEKSVSDMILEKDTKGLSEHMKKGIKNYLQSDQYAMFLKAMGKLHNYSPKNIQLLLSQNKNISMVAGFNTWKKDFQRTVNKGEKSLKIWMPFTVKQKDENGKIKLDDQGKPITFTGFKLGSVFDVSQTNGKDIPKALYELSETKEDYQDLYRSLRATLQESQIDIEWKNLPEAKGYYSPTENKIVLKSGLSSTHTIKTILHEMAHSRLHKDGSFDKLSEAYKLQELQAESIAYVVSNHFGIDTGAYSFGYLASWSDDKKGLSDFESQLSIIQSEAKKIIDTVDAKLEKIKEKGTIENTFENKFSSFKQSKTDKEVGNNLSQNLEKANGL